MHIKTTVFMMIEAMLEQLQSIDKVANGNTDVFLKLFEGVKQTIANNPDALYKSFWLLGGILP